jgi:hypothetical protein
VLFLPTERELLRLCGAQKQREEPAFAFNVAMI